MNTTSAKVTMDAVLALVILLGLFNTVVANTAGHYDYRETVSIWFRGIFGFYLHPALMAGAPLSFKLHGCWRCSSSHYGLSLVSSTSSVHRSDISRGPTSGTEAATRDR